jgi:hypothetical protein
LDSQTEIKTVAGDSKTTLMAKKHSNLDDVSAESRSLLKKFIDYLSHEGYNKLSQYPKNLSHLAKDGANLLDPESVKAVIAMQVKSDGEP